MPRYRITDNQSGNTLLIEANREPSQDEVAGIFSEQPTRTTTSPAPYPVSESGVEAGVQAGVDVTETVFKTLTNRNVAELSEAGREQANEERLADFRATVTAQENLPVVTPERQAPEPPVSLGAMPGTMGAVKLDIVAPHESIFPWMNMKPEEYPSGQDLLTVARDLMPHMPEGAEQNPVFQHAARLISSSGQLLGTTGQWATSPSGIAQQAALTNPYTGIPMAAKFFHDMAKSAGEQLGTVWELSKKPDKTEQDWQSIYDGAVAGLTGLLFAGMIGAGGYKTAKGKIDAAIERRDAKLVLDWHKDVIDEMEARKPTTAQTPTAIPSNLLQTTEAVREQKIGEAITQPAPAEPTPEQKAVAPLTAAETAKVGGEAVELKPTPKEPYAQEVQETKEPVAKSSLVAEQGDVIRWEPNDSERRYQEPVEGIVVDVISNTEGERGYHVLMPKEGDPSNVVRIWENRGKIVFRKPAKVEGQPTETQPELEQPAGLTTSPIAGADRTSPRPKSIVEIADEIAAKGIDPQASYGLFVKARDLKPEISAKEWLPIYRKSLELAKLTKQIELSKKQKPPPAVEPGMKVEPEPTPETEKVQTQFDYSDWENRPQLNVRIGGSNRLYNRQLAEFKRAGIPIKSKGSYTLGSRAQMAVIPNTPEAIALLKKAGGSVSREQWKHLTEGKEPYPSKPTPAPVAAETKPEAKPSKEPWEMTKAEFDSILTKHDLTPREIELLKAIDGWKKKNNKIYPDAEEIGATKQEWKSLFRRELMEKGWPGILSMKARTDLQKAAGINPWGGIPGLEHKLFVEQALHEGKPVPASVLADYKGQPWADAALAKLEPALTPTPAKAAAKVEREGTAPAQPPLTTRAGQEPGAMPESAPRGEYSEGQRDVFRTIADKLRDFVLPKPLAGAKPRYGYQAEQFVLRFASDADRAAYIASSKKGTRSADYKSLLDDIGGYYLSDVLGKEIRSKIKALVQDADYDKLEKSGDAYILDVPPVSEPFYRARSGKVSGQEPKPMPQGPGAMTKPAALGTEANPLPVVIEREQTPRFLGKQNLAIRWADSHAGRRLNVAGGFKSEAEARSWIEQNNARQGTEKLVIKGEQGTMPQGPGAKSMRQSTRQAEEPETYEGTALKNAVAEMERAGLGLADAPEKVKREMAPDWVESGRVLEQNPVRADELLGELKANPNRGLSTIESAILLRKKAELLNAINASAERSFSSDPATKADALAAGAKLKQQLSELLDAAQFRGTSWGREGRWRQAIAYEDFSFAAMERRAMEAKATKELSETDRTYVKATSDKLKELETKLAGRDQALEAERKAIAEKAFNDAMAKLEAEAKASPTYHPDVIAQAERWVKRAYAKAVDYEKELSGADWSGIETEIPQGPGAKTRTPSPQNTADIFAKAAYVGAEKLARGILDKAKWTEAMVKGIGEGFRRHADKVFDMAKAKLTQDLAVLDKQIGKKRATQVKEVVERTKGKDDLAKVQTRIDKVLEKEHKMREAMLAELFFPVRRAARILVDRGLRGREELVDALHELLPELSRTEVKTVLSGYGRYQPLRKDTTSLLIRDYAGQLQQIRKLEDMANIQPPRKTGLERRVPSQEERVLQKQVAEAKKKGGYIVTDPATQLKSALDAVKTRLSNQIADLEQQIAKRERIISDRRKLEYDDAANRLKQRRDELKQQFDAIFRTPDVIAAERLAAWKERTTERITELRQRMAEGDFAPRPKPDPIVLDTEGRRIRADMEQVKDQYRAQMELWRLGSMNVFQKGKRLSGMTWDIARNLMTTGEFSFVLRQGKLFAMSRPIATGRAVLKAVRALTSERYSKQAELEIREHPDYDQSQRDKLHISREGDTLNHAEELVMGRMSRLIPVVKQFNRAAVTFLNTLRFQSYLALKRTLGRFGEVTPAEGRQIAMFVNEATGRGGLGIAESSGYILGRIFFAPRYLASRMQLAVGHSMWGGSFRSRAVIASEYARSLAGLFIYYNLVQFGLNQLLPDDKKIKLSFDPRSSDFGKLVLGQTRIDVLAGLAQLATFGGRTITGETKPIKGPVRLIRPKGKKQVPYGQSDWFEVASRFTLSKTHPGVATIVNLLNGVDLMGNETSLQTELGKMVGPITYFDIYQAFRAQGIPEATALSILAFLGEGLQTYNPNKKKK